MRREEKYLSFGASQLVSLKSDNDWVMDISIMITDVNCFMVRPYHRVFHASERYEVMKDLKEFFAKYNVTEMNVYSDPRFSNEMYFDKFFSKHSALGVIELHNISTDLCEYFNIPMYKADMDSYDSPVKPEEWKELVNLHEDDYETTYENSLLLARMVYMLVNYERFATPDSVLEFQRKMTARSNELTRATEKRLKEKELAWFERNRHLKNVIAVNGKRYFKPYKYALN